VAADDGGEVVFDSRGVWILKRTGPDSVFRCTSEAFGNEPYKTARFDPEFRRGTIVMNGQYFRSDVPINPLEYPLDELLVTNLLARAGGAELHACGAVTPDGRGMVFLGQSGAGKSTMGRLLEGAGAATVISDDRVIVRPMNGTLVMYGTPWHGEAGHALSRNAPLTGVFFLEQAAVNEIVPLHSASAVARLMSCSFPPFYDRDAVDGTLQLFDAITGAVPCRLLRFLPEVSAVRCVESVW
jgi:hypothetical protein